MAPERKPSMAKPHQIAYRDWTILLFPGADGYRPLCVASETDLLTDRTPYPTPEQAIASAQRFIDEEIARRDVA